LDYRYCSKTFQAAVPFEVQAEISTKTLTELKLANYREKSVQPPDCFVEWPPGRTGSSGYPSPAHEIQHQTRRSKPEQEIKMKTVQEGKKFPNGNYGY
jgi:hypothetical protein